MKTFNLHLDMILVTIFLFILSVAGNLYQRYLHEELHKEYIALKLEHTSTQIELKGALKKENKLGKNTD
jgi:hypothetical protein